MALRLLFLGKLADLAGAGERAMDAPQPLGWDALMAALGGDLAAEIDCEKVRVALNGTVIADKTTIRAGDDDELAFLPPVSGG